MNKGKRIFTGYVAALVAATIGIAACGSHTTVSVPKSVLQACPQASNGHGSMGGCTPPVVKTKLKLTLKNPAAPFGPKFPDFSNNDPCYCGAALRAHGIVGEIDKTNQGIGFIDRTFVGMVQNARANGLAVGGYDFVQEYNAQEVYTFINRLHAAGIWRWTTNTFPPTLDVEYGAFSYTGLQHMINILEREYGRVQIYTGGWYYEPHAGCRWPGGVSAWLSGYPNATPVCGLPSYLFAEHQFADNGFNGVTSVDLSVYRFSNFKAFVHSTPPKPKPSPRAKEAELRAINARIRVLHNLETKHKCRIIHGRKAYGACRVWGPEGQHEHARAKRVENEIHALERKGSL
jgi:Glycosyl hydrolases family 25